MFEYKEKKKRIFHEGVELASFCVRYPCFERLDAINAFYEEAVECAFEWFCGEFYERALTEYEDDPDPQKRFKVQVYRYIADFLVGQNDENILSVKNDVRLFRGKRELVASFFDAQCFDISSQLILPPRDVLKKYCRSASKEIRTAAKRSAVYLDGKEVFVLVGREWQKAEIE